jgi:hypothetical protein
MNPYQSPLSDCKPLPPHTAVAPGTWLVKTSLTLAILIEVFPTETDLLVTARFRAAGISYLVAVKAVTLPIILGPLIVYLGRYGKIGFKNAKGKIIAIGIIAALSLMTDLLWYIFFP